MIDEDDDLTNGQADDVTPAEGKQSEEKAKAKAAESSETETDDDATDDADKAEDGDESKDEEEKPKKRRSGVDRLRRERDALRVEIETLRSRAPAADDSAAIDAAVRREIGEPPKEDDYPNDWFAFERALTAYEVQKSIVSREVKKGAQQAVSQSTQHIQDLIEDFNERSAETAKAIPDFLEALSKTSDTTHPISDVVKRLLLESEKGPLLQYHFAKNAADLRRINALPPMSAAREIGRLEARLSLAKPNTATKAPPPVSAIKGGAAPSSQEARMEAYLKRQYGERA